MRGSGGDVRSAALVSLSGSEVVILQNGSDQHLPLDQANHVEVKTHHVRNSLLGLVGGGLLGVGMSASLGDDGRCIAPPAFSVYGLGVRALVGVVLNRRPRGQSVL